MPKIHSKKLKKAQARPTQTGGSKPSLKKPKRGIALLENGMVYPGYVLGAKDSVVGEFVFHTGHTGYQEILTDPSYQKQVITFTAAHIGNQGFHPDDMESQRVWASAALMRNYTDGKTQWRWKQSLNDFLKQEKVPALYAVDTRRLVLSIRNAGNLWGAVSTETSDPKNLQKLLDQQWSMEGLSLVREVSTKTSYTWLTHSVPLLQGYVNSSKSTLKRCLVYDFGVKRQILRYLLDSGFEEVVVVPSSTSAEEVKALSPDAILLSNGPGDPASEKKIVEEIKRLIGKYPMFGICLGHQILGLALGLKTHKLKFGHHAANHPVKNRVSDRVEMSSQNHGFALEVPESFRDVWVTHINMNDQSVAGFVHKTLPICGIQFHPESSPGPIDSVDIFRQFHLGDFKGLSRGAA